MRRFFAVLTALALGLLVAPKAQAYSGSLSDGDDSPGVLDIAAIFHSDTASTVTYGVTFRNTWDANNTPTYKVQWLLDLDFDNVFDEGCVILARNPQNPNVDLYHFSLYQGDCRTNVPSTAVQQGSASRPDSQTAQFTVNLQNLRDAGLGNSQQYRYNVTSWDNGSDAVPTDRAPDDASTGLTHTLGDVQTTTSTTPPGGGGGGGGGGGVTTTTLPGTTQTAASVDKSVVDAGDPVTLSASGFAANADLTETIQPEGLILGTARADSTGRFIVTVRIPANTLPGSHTLVVSGAGFDGRRREAVATITVLLPRTGAVAVGRTAATGIAVVSLGFAVLLLAYYERHRVSVGATRATAAINAAFKHFDI